MIFLLQSEWFECYSGKVVVHLRIVVEAMIDVRNDVVCFVMSVEVRRPKPLSGNLTCALYRLQRMLVYFSITNS